MKRGLLGVALAAVTAAGGAAGARADGVEYLNSSLDAFGGAWSGQPFAGVAGRFGVPLGSPTGGAQADAIVASEQSALYFHLAGHVFARHSTGLIGAYGSWTEEVGLDTFRGGAEAELYLNHITLSAVGGWRVIAGNSDGAFGQLRASLYLTPDTKIYGGYIFDTTSIANAGFEHRIAGSSFALFGEGRWSAAVSGGWVGLRLYVGPAPVTKSISERDRQDLAPLWMHLTD